MNWLFGLVDRWSCSHRWEQLPTSYKAWFDANKGVRGAYRLRICVHHICRKCGKHTVKQVDRCDAAVAEGAQRVLESWKMACPDLVAQGMVEKQVEEIRRSIA